MCSDIRTVTGTQKALYKYSYFIHIGDFWLVVYIKMALHRVKYPDTHFSP